LSYVAWKLLHLAAVVIFLGNITVGVFWAMRAHQTRDLRLIASTFDGIIRSDRWFTIPGVIGIVVGGIGAAVAGHLSILKTGWILWSILLFVLSGLAFGVLGPLQRKILALTNTADDSSEVWETYDTMYRKWSIWGAFALAMPAVAFVIMVTKPSLPGF
jgi:uncharacterized membrane protein